MLDKIHDIIKSDFADPSHINFILAVSGGKDSMVLASCFQKLGLNFEVLHCHFGLRPEAYKETILVLKWCADFQKKAFAAYFPTSQMERHGKSIQEQCRSLRYTWFNAMKISRENSVLVTAHHAADERETFLINLIRGSGINGLAGMRSSASSVYRPMLSITQEEITDFAVVHAVPYLDDISNLSDEYLRNDIRINLLPKFEQLDRNAMKGLRKSIGNLKEASNYIQDQLNFYTSKFVTKHTDGLNISCIAEWPSFLLKTFLAQLGFGHDVIHQIFDNPEGTGRVFKSKELHLLTVDNGFYIIYQNRPNIDLKISDSGTFRLDEQRMVVIKNIQIPGDMKSLDVSKEVILDADLVKFPIRFRLWQDGDKMTPLGMAGQTKKIQDILTDAKVNKLDKKKVVVVVDKNEEIFWLVGHRISHDVRVTEQSSRYLAISLQNETT